jgi:hypothetical protein
VSIISSNDALFMQGKCFEVAERFNFNVWLFRERNSEVSVVKSDCLCKKM